MAPIERQNNHFALSLQYNLTNERCLKVTAANKAATSSGNQNELSFYRQSLRAHYCV